MFGSVVKTMDIEDLGELLVEKSKNVSRLVLVMYGTPGSGKTTNAERLVNYLNNKYNNGAVLDTDKITHFIEEKGLKAKRKYEGRGGPQTRICEYDSTVIDDSIDMSKVPFAAHLKMDGFHLPLKQLAENLHSRRGCQESFEGELVVQLFKLLVQWETEEGDGNNQATGVKIEEGKPWNLLCIPDFDHKLKDPNNPGRYIFSNTKIIVFEGLYLMLNIEPWCQISQIIKAIKDKKPGSHSPIVEVAQVEDNDVEEMSQRVAARHLRSGLVDSLNDGLNRYFANDSINASVVTTLSNHDFDDYSINTSGKTKVYCRSN
ncbi:unnamed protein product [Pichia kudriavzevii]